MTKARGTNIYDLRDWLTCSECAELSGYSVASIRQLISAKKLLAQKVRGVWRVDRRALFDYVHSATELALNGNRKRLPHTHRSRTPTENAPQPHHDALEPLHEL